MSWRRVLGLIILLAVLGGLLSGCSKRSPIAAGDEYVIYVIADDAEWEKLGQQITEIFEKKLVTPQVETVFEVKRAPASQFSQFKLMQNLLIVSAMEPRSEADQLVEQILDAETMKEVLAGEEYLFVSRDAYARGQFLMILASKDIATLESNIAVYPDYLYHLFLDERNRRLRESLFWLTEGSLERRLREAYGWALKIPRDFKLVEESPENRLVWLRWVFPDMNVFVHWQEGDDPSELTQRWVEDRVSWVLQAYYDSARVVDGYVFEKATTFQGLPAREMYGLWEITTKGAGGPFHAIAFWDDASKRIYLLNLVLYAPGRRKEPWLRRLDLIAETFQPSAKATSRVK
jgi:hypothetical protein